MEDQLRRRAETKFIRYWKNPEKVRQRNREYYYKKRGLEVPEKKHYNKYSKENRLEGAEAIQRLVDKKVKELLAVRTAELDAREKRLKKIEESYTIKAYEPAPVIPSPIQKEPEKPSYPVAPLKFSIGRDDFK